ncbi:hypothetical protein [Kocuria sp. CNJ-770]|uniref:hypothetical protein n=1 Tax=Kocuria sp. CNJ-770 TaxID=1904964 RepID=UPI001115374C|nr:hypothetical protein [Kocuria sp. CNJ-770]
MLTGVDKLLLGLWLLPLGLGFVVGLRAGGDDGLVLLFVSGVVAAMYPAVLAGMLHHARRRSRWADLVAADGPFGRTDRTPPAGEDVPEARASGAGCWWSVPSRCSSSCPWPSTSSPPRAAGPPRSSPPSSSPW